MVLLLGSGIWMRHEALAGQVSNTVQSLQASPVRCHTRPCRASLPNSKLFVMTPNMTASTSRRLQNRHRSIKTALRTREMPRPACASRLSAWDNGVCLSHVRVRCLPGKCSVCQSYVARFRTALPGNVYTRLPLCIAGAWGAWHAGTVSPMATAVERSLAVGWRPMAMSTCCRGLVVHGRARKGPKGPKGPKGRL